MYMCMHILTDEIAKVEMYDLSNITYLLYILIIHVTT